MSTQVAHARVSQSPFANNLLVNPGFEIWQRGAGPFTAGGYTADEWTASLNGGTLSVSRSSSPKYGSYALTVTSTFTGNNILQGVEDYKSLEGEYITFSAWVKTSSVNAFYIRLQDYKGSWELSSSPYHTGSGNWELLTAVKLVRNGLLVDPSGFGHGFGLLAFFYVGTGTALIDGAVLARGYFPEGVPFVPPHPADDLERCLRFYQTTGSAYDGPIWGGNAVNGFNYFRTKQFPTTMYATPTLNTPSTSQSGFPAGNPNTSVYYDGFQVWKLANATLSGAYHWNTYTAEVT